MSDAAVLGVLDALARTQTPYMVVGSLSCNVYTFPRSTQDADIVVQANAAAIVPLLSELQKFFRVDPQMSFEGVTGTTRYVVESRDTGFKIELFLLSADAHDQCRFARRQRLDVEGRTAFVASAEDVIITKLRWSKQGRRTKDIDDARNVIAVQAGKLDWPYVEAWCDRHGTRALLDRVRREAADV
jgi:hypothetical protein